MPSAPTSLAAASGGTGMRRGVSVIVMGERQSCRQGRANKGEHRNNVNYCECVLAAPVDGPSELM